VRLPATDDGCFAGLTERKLDKSWRICRGAPAQKTQMKIQLYQTVKPTYIFQGLTAEIVWLPEAVRFFNVRIDMDG
jgi:hypothetical protein